MLCGPVFKEKEIWDPNWFFAIAEGLPGVCYSLQKTCLFESLHGIPVVFETHISNVFI